MSDLRGVRVKIDRAKKHFADLETAIRAFEARRPYGVTVKKGAEPGQEIHYFRLLESLPDEWAAILGDCVHNLRSGLDLLANSLVIQNGSTPTDYTAFPVGSDRTNFQSSGITRLKGASAAAIKLVCRLKPYRGGNDTLYRLHRLDIADKHQLLIPVAFAHEVFAVEWNISGPGLDHLAGTVPMQRLPALSRKFPLKDGDELGTYRRLVADGYNDKTKFEYGFIVAFGEGQVFDGEAVIPTLDQLINFTERLIDIFAQRIFRCAW